MKRYELMVIFDGRKSEDELNSLLALSEGIVKDSKAENITKEIWGIKDLAYPINKSDKGYYVIFRFDSEGRLNKEIEKKLNMNEDIFRYLIIRDENAKIAKKMEARAARKEANLKKRKEQESKDEKDPKKAPRRRVFKKEEPAQEEIKAEES